MENQVTYIFVHREVMSNELTSWSVAWKLKKNWKLGDKEVFGISVWMGLWEWVQSVKSFVLYGNAQQRPSTLLYELKTQVYRIAESTIIQPLLPAITVLLSGHMNLGSLTHNFRHYECLDSGSQRESSFTKDRVCVSFRFILWQTI